MSSASALLTGRLFLPDQHVGVLAPLPAGAAAGLDCFRLPASRLASLAAGCPALGHSCPLPAWPEQDNPCSNRSCCNLAVQIPHMNGVAKIDLSEQDPKKAVAGVYRFQDSWVGGESYFVPASDDPAACNGEQALPPLPSLQLVRCFCWAWVHQAFALAWLRITTHVVMRKCSWWCGCSSPPRSSLHAKSTGLQVIVAMHTHCR